MTRAQTASSRDWRVAVLVAAPATLLVALAAHPFIEGRLPNQTAIAEEVVAGTTRWGVVHLAAALASALIAVAFLAIRQYIHQAGEDRLSGLAMPLVIVGSTLYAVMPGMEFAVLAAAETGATTAEVAEVQGAIGPWFMSVLIASGLTFGLGAICFVGAIRASKIASARITQVVSVALVVMAVSRIIPLSVTQFYTHGLAAVVAMWPLAYVMRTNRRQFSDPSASTVGQSRAPRKVGVFILVLAAVSGTVVARTSAERASRQVQLASSEDAAATMPVGARLIESLANRDFDQARSLLAPGIQFKGYTPTKGFFELSGADAVMGLYREWYEAESVAEAIETERVVDRNRVGYRIRWKDAENKTFVFQQQAFYDVADGLITHLQLVCSGDRPLTKEAA